MWNINVTDFLQHHIIQYVDIDFTLWLTWCLAPLLITFLLPFVIVFLLYLTGFILYIYKLRWRNIRETLQIDKWEAARKTAGAIWDYHGWLWHGYEVDGLENIPTDRPALLIYYHGAIPIDIYYLIVRVLFEQNRLIHTVADHFLFRIPGFSIIADCMKVIPGTVQSCSNVLKDGNLLAIAPGGVYEAQFSHHYSLMWKKRLGFAKAAIDAKVPIIPIFTENCREAFRTVSIGRRFFLKIYAQLKFPVAPIYGGYPVKMITHVGKPIEYDPDVSPEDLQSKVATAINDLVQQHQRIPGSILYGILDRFNYFHKKNAKKKT